MSRPQVVVVTGASAGVGRATARAFAKTGAVVGLIARGRDRLAVAKQEVDELGGRGVSLPADVADADAIEAAAAAMEDQHGAIDVWVNNAMASVFSPVHQMTVADYRRVTDVTYLGVVHGTLAALRRMRPRDAGIIIQVGSALAYRGIPLQSAYCAAKHAVQGFCDSLRSELLREGSGVRLTMVQLPAMNTPQFDWVKSRMPRRAQPVPPIYQPDVAAEAIVWASRHARREIWVGSPTVQAIVGNRIAPGLLDRYLALTGVESQQTAEPEDPTRPDNLWEPVPGDPGAYGRFGAGAREFSPQLWASLHRGLMGAAAAGLVLGIALSGRFSASTRSA
jgi:NADP-dependent 3-hydroxy acid dehydrogenase YdfG